MAAYESILCVKNEVFVYQIPARPSNRGYRAADWSLDKPDWVGRMKIIAKESNLHIRLEDKNTGELFAQCPVDGYPSMAVEQVLDSSRYFVIRIQDESGRKAFIGIGFADRGDSFDLLVAIQDHFKWVKREETQKEEDIKGADTLQEGPKLDLGFKEGQTIRINISTKRQGDENSPSHSKVKSRGQTAGKTGILAPPPGGASRIAPPPRAPSAVADTSSSSNVSQNNAIGDLWTSSSQRQPDSVSSSSGANNVDLLLNLGSFSGASPALVPSTNTAFQPLQPQPAAKPADPWGDFTSATSSSSTSKSNQQGTDWVSFE